jgi:hypothetical protein
VREWRVDVVVYHEQMMKNHYYGGSLIKNYTSIYQSNHTQITMESGLVSTDNLLFYGFYTLVKNSSNQSPLIFNISSVTGASYFDVSLGPYSMSMDLFYMYFQITINCPNT